MVANRCRRIARIGRHVDRSRAANRMQQSYPSPRDSSGSRDPRDPYDPNDVRRFARPRFGTVLGGASDYSV